MPEPGSRAPISRPANPRASAKTTATSGFQAWRARPYSKVQALPSRVQRIPPPGSPGPSTSASVAAGGGAAPRDRTPSTVSSSAGSPSSSANRLQAASHSEGRA